MATVICSNNLCKKEYHKDFDKCPFCGKPNTGTSEGVAIGNSHNLLITTTPMVDGYEVKEYHGIVKANMVIGTNVFKDLFASLSDFFGGFSGKYKEQMDELYSEALKQLSESAVEKGANSILGLQVNFSEISGKDKSMFMVSLTGTAATIKQLPNYRKLHLMQDLRSFLNDGLISQEEYDKEVAIINQKN